MSQHELLTHVATLVEAGSLHPTNTLTLNPISAANLDKAYAQVAAGHMLGKLVLACWADWLREQAQPFLLWQDRRMTLSSRISSPFSRLTRIAAATAVLTSLVAPQAAALSPEEEQFRTDPVGAVAWQTIMSSYNALRANEGAFTAASYFSMTRPGESIGMPGLQRCAEGLGSSSPLGAVRFVTGALCASFDPASRAEAARLG
ncbi:MULTISPECIES: hypothetical protein [Corynebacterium]|nr:MULTISPECIES: hypothetical protein [Corynebacterium]